MIYKLQCQKKGSEKKQLPEIITKTSDDDSYVINLKNSNGLMLVRRTKREVLEFTQKNTGIGAEADSVVTVTQYFNVRKIQPLLTISVHVGCWIARCVRYRLVGFFAKAAFFLSGDGSGGIRKWSGKAGVWVGSVVLSNILKGIHLLALVVT